MSVRPFTCCLANSVGIMLIGNMHSGAKDHLQSEARVKSKENAVLHALPDDKACGNKIIKR